MADAAVTEIPVVVVVVVVCHVCARALAWAPTMSPMTRARMRAAAAVANPLLAYREYQYPSDPELLNVDELVANGRMTNWWPCLITLAD